MTREGLPSVKQRVDDGFHEYRAPRLRIINKEAERYKASKKNKITLRL